ncbi:MAG: hypothetical protein P0Y62_09630 [Candidatus Chryseobacterium colombiense]|nr:hypothetical protein [Chryseobacterium sp.]WEK68134.1 MAG: hypothetical protein P0Y62_09630 [Chryseobacterium sp.]
MKNIILKICLSFTLFLLYNCKAQTTSDYITFYNGVVPKLNTIAANKTQYYGQNFSTFYNELLNKNIQVASLSCDYKTDPGSKYYVLRLFFEDNDLWSVASDHDYQYPWVSITFENEIPKQIENMVKQTYGVWNNDFVIYFSNMKIEKIKFVGVNGYNSNDWSGK